MDHDIVWADSIAYRYPQNDYGLAPTSLTMRSGDAMLITGPSGCGKSTLARCLTGLIPHLYRGRLSGKVWLDGCCTSETPLWQLTERAGLVFQNPAAQMLAVTVEEEIVFGLENLASAAVAGCLGHFCKFLVKWTLGTITGAPIGFVALGSARAIVGYVVFGVLGGMLGSLTLRALRRAGFFAYLAEKQ